MARDGVPRDGPPASGETTGGPRPPVRHTAGKQHEDIRGRPPDTGEEEPGWLDEDLPPDPDGDERDFGRPGEAAEIAADAAAEQALEDEIHARIIAGGLEHGYAHTPGAPSIPGVKAGPGGGFGQNEPLDTAVPETMLAFAADYAAGRDRQYGRVCDDELFGVLSARHRLESRQAWEQLMAVAELIRRRPAGKVPVDKETGMPGVWGEGLAGELTLELAISRRAADSMLSLAWDLAAKLPMTSAALRDGLIDEAKAAAIAAAFAT
jgi:hypothetical protein